jgi:hypothetical protein
MQPDEGVTTHPTSADPEEATRSPLERIPSAVVVFSPALDHQVDLAVDSTRRLTAKR